MVKNARHESFTRLLDSAAEKGYTDRAELADMFGESVHTVGNWARRGVSKDGAQRAQERLGCSATWILYGRIDSPQQAIPQAAEPTRPQRAIAAPAQVGSYSAEIMTVAKWLHELSDPAIRDKAIRSCMKIALDADHAIRSQPTPEPVQVASPEIKHA